MWEFDCANSNSNSSIYTFNLNAVYTFAQNTFVGLAYGFCCLVVSHNAHLFRFVFKCSQHIFCTELMCVSRFVYECWASTAEYLTCVSYEAVRCYFPMHPAQENTVWKTIRDAPMYRQRFSGESQFEIQIRIRNILLTYILHKKETIQFNLLER